MERVAHLSAPPATFLRRIFTVREQEQLAARAYKARHLAARFTDKEAVFKLLGCGIGSLAWTEVEIISLLRAAAGLSAWTAKQQATNLHHSIALPSATAAACCGAGSNYEK